MPTAEKVVKERDCTQMPVAKKEPTTNACGKERKTKPQMLVANENGCPNQSSKQLTPNERRKNS